MKGTNIQGDIPLLFLTTELEERLMHKQIKEEFKTL